MHVLRARSHPRQQYASLESGWSVQSPGGDVELGPRGGGAMAEGEARPALQGHYGITREELDELNDIAVKAGGTGHKKAHMGGEGEENGGAAAQPLSQEEQAEAANMKQKMHQRLKELGGVAGLGQKLGVEDLSVGLSMDSVGIRREDFGPNRYKEVPPKTFFGLLFEVLQDPMLVLLCLAALVSTVLGVTIPEERAQGGWVEGVAIWVAVLVVSTVGAGNDYSKDKQFRKLNSEREVFDVTVMRGGKEEVIKNVDVVVGDVLKLEAGNAVVADGFFVQGFKLKANESSVTGESEPIMKGEQEPYLISGSYIVEGSGTMVVTAVGEQSFYGKTLEDVMGEAPDTELQIKLADLAAAIGKLGMAVGAVCFVVLTIEWLVLYRNGAYAQHGTDVLNYFLFAVTIVVVAVPEGLPLAVTIALAYSMRKMLTDKIFVRVLASCETMGGAMAICSDKTGTLTENQMTIVEGYFFGKHYKQTPRMDALRKDQSELIYLNATLNSECFKTIDEVTKKPVFAGGNATEQAFLLLADQWGVDYRQMRQKHPLHRKYIFSSATKMSHAVFRHGQGYRMFTKGAWDWVIEECTHATTLEGKVVAMSGDLVKEATEVAKEMASRGLRCLAMTYCDLPGTLKDDDFEEPPLRDPVLCAVVGIKDPVRKEVPHAVAQCRRAGITVRMVTGDNQLTATYIARECGILFGDGVVMDGDEFREMPDEELDKVIDRLQVLARSKPKDKKRLVKFLMERRGDIVAVTGDGTNDAPALKEASVGLAMGIAGTMVAKAASDIVITDDNFNSIVKAVMWGRNIFDAIRKFLQFQLTINCVALLIAFSAAIAQKGTPLNVIQLLWVNLVMDSMAALALATELPTEELLNRKPYGKSALISRKMWKHIFIQGIYQFVALMLLIFVPPKINDYYRAKDCTLTASQLDDRVTSSVLQDQTLSSYLTAASYSRGELKSALLIDREYTGRSYRWPVHPSGCLRLPDGALPGGNYAHNRQMTELVFTEWQTAQESHVNTMVFNTFIFLQLFNEVNARKIDDEINVFDGIFTNHIFLGVMIVTTGLQLIFMLTPVGTFFVITPLNKTEWGINIAIAAASWPLSFLTRIATKMFFPAA